MEKYIITKDVILLMARVAATLEVGAALETPEKYHTSQYGELLKDLAADIYDCMLFSLEPYQENNEAPNKEKIIEPEKKELPDWSKSLPICEIMLHSLDASKYDSESLKVFMHKYPESKPERLPGYKEYLILDRNEEYHIAYLDMNNCFVDPENDYLPYPKDFIKGWLSIV
jgi:hypothetical protein